MTTAQPPTRSGDRPARVGTGAGPAFLVTLGAGVVLVVVAALVGGGPAAAGTGVGTAMVCVFFGFGAVVLGVVAAVTPAASLLVALLTYTLQVVLMGMVFVVLARSGALGTTVDAGWLAGTVIGGTLLWLGAQIYAHAHARQPLYDLPPNGTQEGAR